MDTTSDKHPERTDSEVYQYTASPSEQASFVSVNILFYAIFFLLFFLPFSALFTPILGETWEMYAIVSVISMIGAGAIQLRTIKKFM